MYRFSFSILNCIIVPLLGTISIRRLLASSIERVSCFEENILMTCAALASVCIITSFVLTVSDLSAPSTAVPEPVPGESASDSVSSPAAEAIEGIPVNAVQYYLREHNGKLAVFAPDSDVPELVFDVYLSTLPAYDRGQLQMGIPIYSYEELVQRIEDYIS